MVTKSYFDKVDHWIISYVSNWIIEMLEQELVEWDASYVVWYIFYEIWCGDVYKYIICLFDGDNIILLLVLKIGCAIHMLFIFIHIGLNVIIYEFE